jgi:hypothetical protein
MAADFGGDATQQVSPLFGGVLRPARKIEMCASVCNILFEDPRDSRQITVERPFGAFRMAISTDFCEQRCIRKRVSRPLLPDRSKRMHKRKR